jgi:hypothetical protein
MPAGSDAVQRVGKLTICSFGPSVTTLLVAASSLAGVVA